MLLQAGSSSLTSSRPSHGWDMAWGKQGNTRLNIESSSMVCSYVKAVNYFKKAYLENIFEDSMLSPI